VGSSYTFIEAPGFTEAVQFFFEGDDSYAELQAILSKNPEIGKVIPGGSPLRKLRWLDSRRGKGKRGGLRIIYVHVPDIRVLMMIDIYGKGEAEDLSNSTKRVLKVAAREAIESIRTGRNANK